MAGLKELNISPQEADKRIEEGLTLEKRMSDKEFDNCPIEDVVRIGRLVNNSKITSRWLERWIAKYCNGWANPSSPDGKDVGDLYFNPIVTEPKIGEDNSELKSCEKDLRFGIGGGQHRFFENIPFYLYLQFEQETGNNTFDLYLLHKNDVHKEIFEYKVCRCAPSQVSGQTKKNMEGKIAKMDDEEVRSLVQESFDKKNTIVWGFGIDSHPGEFTRKEPKRPKKENVKNMESYNKKYNSYMLAKEAHKKKVDTVKRWKENYKININDLRDNWTEVKKKYGI